MGVRARDLLLISAPALCAAACFVSEGECVRNGVSVTPCAIQLRPGQTAVLTAEVTDASGEGVVWILPPAADPLFVVVDPKGGPKLTLISKLNVAASVPVQASNAAKLTRYGGAVVGVSAATFGSQAPPFVSLGGSFPVGSKEGATAVGVNLFFVGYAEGPSPLPGEAGLGPLESTNNFIKRYTLGSNQLTADVPDQFLLFAGPDSPIFPNVVADCVDTAYWIDLESAPDGYVLRRLRAGSDTVETRAFPDGTGGGLFQHMLVRSLAVDCDGPLYFIADDLSTRSLWRLASFEAEPERVVVPEPGGFADSYESLVVDELGRLLAGTRFPDAVDGIPPLVRLTVRSEPFPPPQLVGTFLLGELDPGFDIGFALGGVGSFALDLHGAIYASRDPSGDGQPPTLLNVHNTLGQAVFVLDRFVYRCPTGCSQPACGTQIPFEGILWVGVGSGGQLRIIDRPAFDPGLPAACQETVRLVMLDPQ